MGTSAATLAIETLFCPPKETMDKPRKKASYPDALKCGATRRARDEARSLFRLIGQDGQTLRSVRGLIIIPPRDARELFAFLEAHPDQSVLVFGVIGFRNEVLREFDALASRAEHAEQIAAAEVEAARLAAEYPVLPLLHELVAQSI